MATGANACFWSGAELPAIYKPALLKRYVPEFVMKTG